MTPGSPPEARWRAWRRSQGEKHWVCLGAVSSQEAAWELLHQAMDSSRVSSDWMVTKGEDDPNRPRRELQAWRWKPRRSFPVNTPSAR